MNYSISNYLGEPRVKEKDGIMLTTGAPLKFVILQPQDINKIYFSIKVLLTKNGIKNDPIKIAVLWCLFYSEHDRSN